jgi:hypothetical protein
MDQIAILSTSSRESVSSRLSYKEVVRADSTIQELNVPYYLREIARLETGKRIRVTQAATDDALAPGAARLTFRPRDEELRKRYAQFFADESASHALRRTWSSPTQQVHVERSIIRQQLQADRTDKKRSSAQRVRLGSLAYGEQP